MGLFNSSKHARMVPNSQVLVKAHMVLLYMGVYSLTYFLPKELFLWKIGSSDFEEMKILKV